MIISAVNPGVAKVLPDRKRRERRYRLMRRRRQVTLCNGFQGIAVLVEMVVRSHIMQRVTRNTPILTICMVVFFVSRPIRSQP